LNADTVISGDRLNVEFPAVIDGKSLAAFLQEI
jgi:hypothetical protein